MKELVLQVKGPGGLWFDVFNITTRKVYDTLGGDKREINGRVFRVIARSEEVVHLVSE